MNSSPRAEPPATPLARFVAALGGAAERGTVPGSAASAAARRMLAALAAPARPGRATGAGPATLAACRHLDAALANARAGPPAVAALAEAFALLAPQLAWRRRSGSEAAGTTFHHGHANAWIVGPEGGADGLERRSDVAVGTSLLAPAVRYPEHRHPPEELYVAMSEGEWFREDAGWYRPGIGGVVHHRPNVTHAMRAGDAPLLAVWCLWTGSV